MFLIYNVILLFLRSLDRCCELYKYFYMQLGYVFIVDSNDLEDRRLVDMFHSHIEPESVPRIPNIFL